MSTKTLKKTKLLTQLSFAFEPAVHAEKGGGLSETIPDQTLSLKDIITRFTRSGTLPEGRQPEFHGEDVDGGTLERFSKLDLVDRENYRKNHSDGLKAQSSALKAKASKKKKEEQEAALKSTPVDNKATDQGAESTNLP